MLAISNNKSIGPRIEATNIRIFGSIKDLETQFIYNYRKLGYPDCEVSSSNSNSIGLTVFQVSHDNIWAALFQAILSIVVDVASEQMVQTTFRSHSNTNPPLSIVCNFCRLVSSDPMVQSFQIFVPITMRRLDEV